MNMFIQTLNPSNAQFVSQYKLESDDAVQAQIVKTQEAFLEWRKLSLDLRIGYIKKIIQLLNTSKQECAELITQEMGKPIQFSIAEIEKCILCCEFYCENAKSFLSNHETKTEFKASFVTYNPFGIILAVMPWNFPFWQVFRFLVPNLLAGNAILLKHASVVTGCGQKIQDILEKAGLPMDLFRHLLISSSQVDKIISHPLIRGVTLTGSEAAGKEIAKSAGFHLKKAVLELGGNDACVVLQDADVKLAAKSIVSSRLRNSGQVCVATKRVIVEKSVHSQLISQLVEEMKKYSMANPMSPETTLGPMAREDLRLNIHTQVEAIIKQGATLICGGFIPEGPGFYYPPTLIDNVMPNSLAYEEELFGPVVTVTPVNDLAQAIEFANSTRFGLGGSIFTSNLALGEKYAQDEMECGLCFVNMPVTSDPRFPFGGIKDSGYGRELSKEGMLEFVNIKTVIVHE
jgi:succinate-semialdehyde dehydrogenase/glutarate-semialdehyde dehydrogenase